jgi:plastocyanin
MRPIVRTLLAFALALLGAACSGSEAPPACDEPQTTTSVEMLDFEFAPGCVQAATSDTLEVANAGEAPHTFSVRDADLSVDAAAGETGSVALEGLAPGTYGVYCVYHSQMTAALRVV